MNALSRGLAVATVALAMGAASVASADTVSFAGFTPNGTNNLKFVRSANTAAGHFGKDAKFYTGQGGAAAATRTTFNFLVPSLIALGLQHLDADFLMDATVANQSAVAVGDDFLQEGINGTFSFKLTSALTPAQQAACLNSCTNLLSATFKDAWIIGHNGTGLYTNFAPTADPIHHPLRSIVFTSDFLDFSATDAWTFSLNGNDVNCTGGTAQGCTSSPNNGLFRQNITTGPAALRGQKALSSFKVTSSGNFGTSPPPTTYVPEPATWALMIIGFGGAGATLRRRKAIAA